MAPADLLLRTRAFSLAVLEFCRTLPHTDEAREAAGQVRRAANGLRSNYRAARKGRIKHDPALLQEATELAKILATAYRTSRRNNEGNASRT